MMFNRKKEYPPLKKRSEIERKKKVFQSRKYMDVKFQLHLTTDEATNASISI